MSGRSRTSEIRVGLLMIFAAIGVLTLYRFAAGGPGFLASNRTVEVLFRDGQGLREGSTVRIAGIDSGRVVGVDLAEIDGIFRAKIKIALPVELAAKLKQDVRITIQSGLTGQSRVNVVSSGTSTVSLVPGQVVNGVETTFFDPILEQVGLGPVERSNISHTIGEVRSTVDALGPRVRQILTVLNDTAEGLRETADAVRPDVEATTQHVEELARRINSVGPKLEAALNRLDSVTLHADQLLAENRPNLKATVADVREVMAMAKDIAETDRKKIDKLLDGLDGTRARADRVLYQADIIATQGQQMITTQRADLERTIANVRDATDWGDRLVQKLFANPYFLSPFYKPSPEDVRVQAVYDTAQVFTKGARELHDAVKALESLQSAARTPEERAAVAKLYEKTVGLTSQLNATTQQLSESLKTRPKR